MKSTYACVNHVPRGSGTFMRMKVAMAGGSQFAVSGMFNDAVSTLLKGIKALIKDLKAQIQSTSDVIRKIFDNVFSICWDDQQSEALISPEVQKAIRECRDALLPKLNELLEIQAGACELLGIEREEIELDVMGVETLEQTLARKREEAEKNGDMLNLCDSDAEISIKPQSRVRVKAEKKAGTGPAKSPVPSDVDVIDLCDSDNDVGTESEYSQGNSFSRVKEEAFL